jgi:hypothetical protein
MRWTTHKNVSSVADDAQYSLENNGLFTRRLCGPWLGSPPSAICFVCAAIKMARRKLGVSNDTSAAFGKPQNLSKKGAAGSWGSLFRSQ